MPKSRWAGGYSLADDVGVRGLNVPDPSKITVGPLAEILGNTEKVAFTIGNDNSYTPPEEEEFRSQRPVVDAVKTKSSMIMARNRRKKTSLNPGNLATGSEQSTETGSGPETTFSEGDEKIASAEEMLEIANAEDIEFLKVASVPSSLGYIDSKDPHPIFLLKSLNKELGSDWKDWDPVVIEQTLETMGAKSPPMSEIMALKMILSVPDKVTDRWQVFEKIVLALNGMEPSWDKIEDVEVPWISNTAATIKNILGDEPDYGPEVIAYIAARLADQGYVLAPSHLMFADEKLKTLAKTDTSKIRADTVRLLVQGHPQEGEDPASIQANRILNNNAYVLERLGAA